jgi:hypothetical protein
VKFHPAWFDARLSAEICSSQCGFPRETRSGQGFVKLCLYI